MPRVPDRSTYDQTLDVHMHTGQNARDMAMTFGGRHLATDIETPGLDRSFEIRCVTACWETKDETHAVLLDPERNEADRYAVTEMYRKATMIILHNAPFDVPALVHHELMTMSQISKIVDTLLLARFGFPDVLVPKNLAALAKRYLGMDDNAEGMKLAFKAAGYKTIQAGYEGMDIDSPIYRQGAMLDTLATLRLQPMLRRQCWDRTTNHPFEVYGATSFGEAEAILERQEMVHRVMLRRGAEGINVDREYLAKYAESVDGESKRAAALLAQHGLEGGSGKGSKIIEYIDSIGELPADWPRTPTRKLKATKDLLDAFDHPLAHAQRRLAEIEKIMGYLAKVDHQAEVTGRCHPQIGTLAASATGRMSISMPELQQFSADARPILIADDPHQMWSIDWSQIEPVTMGLMAGDETFLAPFEAGEDLYEPLMRAAGIDRKTAKVCLLATMYGQGVGGLAGRIGASVEQAAQIRRQMLAAMPASARWMTKVQGIADEYGVVITAGGRILPVDKGGVFKSVNYSVQGSAYDVLAHAICEIERAGMGDAILLPMHDELVVQGDEELAREIEQIMLTPPPFLEKWAGRTPVLRTDRECTGTAWASV